MKQRFTFLIIALVKLIIFIIGLVIFALIFPSVIYWGLTGENYLKDLMEFCDFKHDIIDRTKPPD